MDGEGEALNARREERGVEAAGDKGLESGRSSWTREGVIGKLGGSALGGLRRGIGVSTLLTSNGEPLGAERDPLEGAGGECG